MPQSIQWIQNQRLRMTEYHSKVDWTRVMANFPMGNLAIQIKSVSTVGKEIKKNLNTHPLLSSKQRNTTQARKWSTRRTSNRYQSHTCTTLAQEDSERTLNSRLTATETHDAIATNSFCISSKSTTTFEGSLTTEHTGWPICRLIMISKSLEALQNGPKSCKYK